MDRVLAKGAQAPKEGEQACLSSPAFLGAEVKGHSGWEQENIPCSLGREWRVIAGGGKFQSKCS